MPTRRQHFARSAYRALSWGLGIFLLSQLGLSLVLEFWWTSARDPAYGPKIARLKGRLRTNNDARVVVMVGTSRTGDGLRAEPFEADLGRRLGQPVVLFNFGIPGANTPLQLLEVQRLLAEGIKPDLLLFEIMPPWLDDRRARDLTPLEAERLSRDDLRKIRRYPLATDSLPRACLEARAAPWYAQRFHILSMVLPTMLPIHLRQDAQARCDSCGWVPHEVPQRSAEQWQQAREKTFACYRSFLKSFQLGRTSCQMVRMALDECRLRQIKVALVLMPESPLFRGAYPEEVWRQVDPFLEQLHREYDAPTINARCWLGEENFLDGQHLRPDGAARFSERLAREAILPLLRQGERARMKE